MQPLIPATDHQPIFRHRGRGGIRERPVLVPPSDLAFVDVDAEKLILVMANVGHVIYHSGRSYNVGLGIDLFLFLALVEINHMQ